MHYMKWLQRKNIHVNPLDVIYYYSEDFIQVGKAIFCRKLYIGFLTRSYTTFCAWDA